MKHPDSSDDYGFSLGEKTGLFAIFSTHASEMNGSQSKPASVETENSSHPKCRPVSLFGFAARYSMRAVVMQAALSRNTATLLAEWLVTLKNVKTHTVSMLRLLATRAHARMGRQFITTPAWRAA